MHISGAVLVHCFQFTELVGIVTFVQKWTRVTILTASVLLDTRPNLNLIFSPFHMNMGSTSMYKGGNMHPMYDIPYRQ